tara:strand:+ start:296 stop:658 length:363 start_codon:yes stop_codon:yes gene_type:complete
MSNQGRQDFQWRPNDNSSTTLAKYDQEAEHWTRAFNSANKKQNQSGDISEFLNGIGLCLTVIIYAIDLIIHCLILICSWLYKNKKSKPINTKKYDTLLTNSEINKMYGDKSKLTRVDIYG